MLVSKERLPIVELGLFMDRNGIPIYDLHPGATHRVSSSCAVPLEKDPDDRWRQVHLLLRCPVWDPTVYEWQLGGTFIVTQSIKKLSNVLDRRSGDYDYKLLSNKLVSVKH